MILSLNASFMYVGFSVGAAIGSVVITLSSVAWIGAVGAVWVVVAMGLSGLVDRHGRRSGTAAR